MHIHSAINSALTLEYTQHEPENKYFDRKSAKVQPSDLSEIISAFANADGGTIGIGIGDNGSLEGINSAGKNKINDFINAPRDCGLNANEKIFRKNLTKITLKSIVRSEKISIIFMKNSSI